MPRKKKKKINYSVKHEGELVPKIDLDTTTSQKFVVWTAPDQFTLFRWEVDDEHYGYWHITHHGTKNKKIIRVDGDPAFYGEIAIKGARESDMFASASYEDEDIKDLDGNITNKPTEIVLRPKRDD